MAIQLPEGRISVARRSQLRRNPDSKWDVAGGLSPPRAACAAPAGAPGIANTSAVSLLLGGQLFRCVAGPLGHRFLFSQQHIEVIRVVREVAERSLSRSAQVKVNATIVRHAEGQKVVPHTFASFVRNVGVFSIQVFNFFVGEVLIFTEGVGPNAWPRECRARPNSSLRSWSARRCERA